MREYGFRDGDPRYFADLQFITSMGTFRSTFCAYDPSEASRQAYMAAKRLGESKNRPWSFRIDLKQERID
jgi:hypothetical protein